MICIDIRLKLILFILCNLLVFTRKTLIFGILVFCLILTLAFILGQGKLGIKYIAKYIILIGAEYILINSHIFILGVLGSIVIFIRLLLPIIFFADLIIETSRLNELMAALYYFKLPRSFIITLVISIRFFPTLKQELKSIYDGMKLRGYRLSIKNIICRTHVLMSVLLTPILMRSSIIADEIGIAAVTRGIDCPRKRSSYVELSINRKDWIIFLLFISLLFVFMIIGNVYKGEIL
ncbi:MAG: energy-coupling factor transporter transmembrane component T [Anaerococcus sp.]|nr:energy-coupling factor transporter transmembrane component T [Anaerococcus sp.]